MSNQDNAYTDNQNNKLTTNRSFKKHSRMNAAKSLQLAMANGNNSNIITNTIGTINPNTNINHIQSNPQVAHLSSTNQPLQKVPPNPIDSIKAHTHLKGCLSTDSIGQFGTLNHRSIELKKRTYLNQIQKSATYQRLKGQLDDLGSSKKQMPDSANLSLEIGRRSFPLFREQPKTSKGQQPPNSHLKSLPTLKTDKFTQNNGDISRFYQTLSSSKQPSGPIDSSTLTPVSQFLGNKRNQFVNTINLAVQRFNETMFKSQQTSPKHRRQMKRRRSLYDAKGLVRLNNKTLQDSKTNQTHDAVRNDLTSFGTNSMGSHLLNVGASTNLPAQNLRNGTPFMSRQTQPLQQNAGIFGSVPTQKPKMTLQTLENTCRDGIFSIRRTGATLTYINGDLYLFGGCTDQTQQLSISLYGYSLEHRRWNKLSSVNDHRIYSLFYHSAEVYRDNLMFIGGYSIDNKRGVRCYNSNVSIYSLQQKTWSLFRWGKTMRAHASTLFMNTLIVHGGINEREQIMSSMQLVLLNTDNLSQSTLMEYATDWKCRSHQMINTYECDPRIKPELAFDGILAFGGINGNDEIHNQFRVLINYNPCNIENGGQKNWKLIGGGRGTTAPKLDSVARRGSSLNHYQINNRSPYNNSLPTSVSPTYPQARYNHKMQLLPRKGICIMIGGCSVRNQTLNDVWILSLLVNNNLWTRIEMANSSIWLNRGWNMHCMCVSQENSIYVYGGSQPTFSQLRFQESKKMNNTINLPTNRPIPQSASSKTNINPSNTATNNNNNSGSYSIFSKPVSSKQDISNRKKESYQVVARQSSTFGQSTQGANGNSAGSSSINAHNYQQYQNTQSTYRQL